MKVSSSTPTQPSERGLCYRMLWLTALLTLGFSGVVWRLYDLHLKQAPRLAREAALKYREDRVLPAHRGAIRDAQGRFLAHDETEFELQTDRVHLNDIRAATACVAVLRGLTERDVTRALSDKAVLAAYHEHVIEALSTKLAVPLAEVRAKILSPRPVETVAQHISEDDAAEWRQYLRGVRVKGVYVKPAVRRHYPTGNRLALIIGGMKDGTGDRGIERSLDPVLRGIPGLVSIEHDKYGRELPLYQGEMREPVNGRDVTLTIDLQLQDAVDAIVEQAALIYQPRKIAVVVTEANTGSILAMSFLPGHDRGDPKGTNWKNFAIYEPYEPGSTFKTITFTAALDLRKVGLDEMINCEGGEYSDPVLKTKLTDDENLGTVPARMVFAESSNIGTFKIFKRVGREAFLGYVQRFGFGKKTAIELPNEQGGHINAGRWSDDTYSRFPMGYEVNVTPLQMAMAYAAVANGGRLLKPRLVDRIGGAAGAGPEVTPVREIGRVCDERTAAHMRGLLKLVVTEGTGSRARLDGVEVAGKTGTSRRYDPERGGYRQNEYIASFAGFAPADNPKIVCVVMLDDPKASDPKDIRGGKIAAPIFAEVVAETLKQLSLRPDRSVAQTGGEP